MMLHDRIQIGIDVTYAFFRRGGIDEYQFQLASRLAQRADDSFVFKKYANFAPFVIRRSFGVPDPAILRKFKMLQSFLLAKRPESIVYRLFPCDLIHMTSHLYMPFGRKKISTLHDASFLYDDYQTNSIFDFRPHAELMARKCDHFIAVSQFTRDEACRLLRLPDSKVTVIPSGIDERFFVRVEQAALSLVKAKYGLVNPYVLFVSAVSKRKNVPVMLRALELNWPDNLDLVIAGRDGNDTHTVNTMIERSAKKGQVRRIYFVPDADLTALYQGAFAYCLPSFQEGFGFTLLEAMASGIPVVAAENSAMTETAGKAALFFRTNDEGELVERIRELQIEKRRTEMIRLGFDRAREFSWTKFVENTVRIYERVLSG